MKLHLVILFYFIHSFYSLKLGKPINIAIDNNKNQSSSGVYAFRTN